jgi:hypothetical protein
MVTTTPLDQPGDAAVATKPRRDASSDAEAPTEIRDAIATKEPSKGARNWIKDRDGPARPVKSVATPEHEGTTREKVKGPVYGKELVRDPPRYGKELLDEP